MKLVTIRDFFVNLIHLFPQISQPGNPIVKMNLITLADKGGFLDKNSIRNLRSRL